MTSGTFSKLTTSPQVYITNRTTWDLIKIDNYDVLSSGKFTIISNNIQSNPVVDWLVIAERENQKLTIEIDKPKIHTSSIPIDTNKHSV